MKTNPLWLLLQLADGTFPSGGFAHSNGLEASSILGGTDSIEEFLDTSLEQTAHAILPFVRAAHVQTTLEIRRAAAEAAMAPHEDAGQQQQPHLTVAHIDRELDATLLMAAPNRASRAQGRALIGAASRVWTKQLESIAAYAAQTRESDTAPAHHATIFGAIFATLGVSQTETLMAYLHGNARNTLSAGVRLGLLGPLESQSLLADRAARMDDLVTESERIPVEEAAQTSPLLEIYAALHDRLDGRMFQS